MQRTYSVPDESGRRRESASAAGAVRSGVVSARVGRRRRYVAQWDMLLSVSTGTERSNASRQDARLYVTVNWRELHIVP